MENLFCKYYQAINDARLCTAYDARIGDIGIGIKTFILNGKYKIEKIAEFNKLKRELDKCSGVTLAKKLAEFRNDRISFSKRNYNLTESIYHIVGRHDGRLELFNCPYDPILIDEIGAVRSTRSGLTFSDGLNEYSFNSSKSVLMMKFVIPEDCVTLSVDILEDPFALLEQLLLETDETKNRDAQVDRPQRRGIDYVILPLYSQKGDSKYVPPRSGLNQWNAKGRPRDPNEVYIPIPIAVHYAYPNFFPNRQTPFLLKLPTGQTLSAKVCQQNDKALMSNPNQDLGKWLLRDMLCLKEGELVTMEMLNKYGIDSVMIRRLSLDGGKTDSNTPVYSLSFQSDGYESYEAFIKKQ